MTDLSKRIDIVELKPATYRRWRNDLEVALILARCLPAIEHENKPQAIDDAAWEEMRKNAKAIIIKALRDDFWRVSAQDTAYQILEKIQDAFEPTSSLIAVLNLYKFFSLAKGSSQPEHVVRQITSSYSELMRSLQASDFLRNRVIIDESVRTAILAFAIEKSDPGAAQQIKERFERNNISFDQAVTLIAEVRITTSSASSFGAGSASHVVANATDRSSCSYCKGKHSTENCWFKNPAVAPEKYRNNLCRKCKIVGHHTRDCKKKASVAQASTQSSSSSSASSISSSNRKKIVFCVKHRVNSVKTDSQAPAIILDSGCTTHMMRDKHVFSTYQLGPPPGTPSVYTASGQPLPVAGRGEVVFLIRDSKSNSEHDLVFTDVLHVPDLEENILSVCSLDKKGILLSTGQAKIVLRHKGNFVAVAPLSAETSQYQLAYANKF